MIQPRNPLLYDPPALADVLDERDRQDAKWGQQDHDPFAWLAILSEEVGEASGDALAGRFPTARRDGPWLRSYRAEMVQVSAVALAAVEALDREKWRWAGPDVPAEAGGGVKPLVDAATLALELLELGGGRGLKVRDVIEALRKALGAGL